MIEKLLIKYISSKLNVDVVMELPENNFKKLILIEKVGSSENNFIKNAKIAIQSYAPSLLQASELNEKVKEIIRGLIELNDICKVNLESDYNFTDTSIKKYRYQAIFNIFYY